MKTLITIIIPTYNCAGYVKEALDSVFNQTYKNIEVIVVDDGSTDNTKEILSPYIENGKIKYLYQANNGPASARNRGIKEAQGEYVAFLDADDIWLPFKLELQMRHQMKYPNIFAQSTTMSYYGEKSLLFSNDKNHKFRRYFFEDLLIRNYMGIVTTALIKKDILEKIGGFREDLRMCEDHDIWLRLSRLGELHKIMYPTAIYRARPDGLSAGDRDRTNIENAKFIKRIFFEDYPDFKRRYLRKALSINYFHASIEYTEMQKYYMAIKYLILSIIYCPFRFPEKTNSKFLRLRRFFAICKSFIRCRTNIDRKLKVAVLSSGLEHITRGVETWAKDLAYALKDKGINVELYKGSGISRNGFEKSISCVRCGSRLSKNLLKILPSFSWHFGMGSNVQIQETTFSLNLIPELMIRRFDIVHTQDANVANLLRMAGKIGLIKSKVILAHGTEEDFDFIKKFDYLQHLVPFHMEEAVRNGVNGAAKQFAIPNFVDVERFKPLTLTLSPEGRGDIRKKFGIPQDAFVVLCVAAIKKAHKRIDYLINEVSKTKVFLVIAGARTNETDGLIKMGKEKLGNRVMFLTDLAHQRMPEVYTMADVFVLCSLFEMFGIVFLEAMASGLPALGHKHPVFEWIIGEGGECIDMTKKGELAETIEKYMDESYRKEKGLKAREQAVKKFSKDVVVEQIIQMYEEIAK